MGENALASFSQTGVFGILSMVISLGCILLSWWALQNLKLDLIIRHPQSPQGKMLHVLLAIVLGHFVAKFMLDYIGWSQLLRMGF
ncbi:MULTISPECIES: DUF1146 family protein [Saccharibacillus]|jgi:uncharacterized integral membrane protein (TIGR02327 family)|uniref:DUF1146 domain-containing protein n=1 Tax=Saccharibacillus brassicae TaxID=2583377 RepID=A0A4Y6UWT1_SACBS|nr:MULTISPECIES: DUF1146 family protein [Saccharibacillus]MWJ32302.1 DUF1146 domain-containing protein [Saccharibacillus sp. WB 17]QDH20876.1 DUF1146 domain-containing protein [Saccharibacillus brassicae]